MKYLKIKGWDRWQTFRKDRGTPPWIKVYRNLLTNPEWAQLSDSEKGQLVSIWIVAADKGGRVTGNPDSLKKICQLDKTPNIKKFIDLGFMVTTRKPSGDQVVTMIDGCDAPETETETETEESLCPDSKKPEPRPYKFSDDDLIFAKRMYSEILSAFPNLEKSYKKKVKIERWADIIRLMRQIDGLSMLDIMKVWEWASDDYAFWQEQIRSPSNLRKHFETLRIKMKSATIKTSKPSTFQNKRAVNDEWSRKYGNGSGQVQDGNGCIDVLRGPQPGPGDNGALVPDAQEPKRE